MTGLLLVVCSMTLASDCKCMITKVEVLQTFCYFLCIMINTV